MTIFSAALLLFLVMDPFGNVPVFLSVLRPVPEKRRRWIIARELLIALVFLIVFLFGGQYLLAAIGISESSVTVAGGLILFLIALRMVFPSPGGVFGEDAEEAGESPILVPHPHVPRLYAEDVVPEPTRLGRRGLVATERLMGMVLTAIAAKMVLGGVAEFYGL